VNFGEMTFEKVIWRYAIRKSDLVPFDYECTFLFASYLQDYKYVYSNYNL